MGFLVKGNIDVYPSPIQTKEISLRFSKADKLLGIVIPADQQVANLKGLGLEEVSRDGDNRFCFVFQLPEWI